MKKVISAFIVLFCFLNIQAQDIGKINLGVVVPEQIEGLDASQIGKLKTKIEQICVKNGISSGFTSNGFVIYPVFEIYDTEVIEGGMQKIYSVKVEMTLFIKQMKGAGISSITKSYRGNGNSNSKAIVNAISTINISEFKVFITNGKQEILNYYETYCERIIAESEQLAKQELYDESLGLLLSVPQEATCYAKITTVSEQIFKMYQKRQCEQLLAAAQSAMAVQNYLEAADLLWRINPNSSCYPQSQQIIKEVEEKVSEQEKRDWDFKMQQYKDVVKLEQSAIDAAKEVAKAYYENQPEIHYTQVFLW